MESTLREYNSPRKPFFLGRGGVVANTRKHLLHLLLNDIKPLNLRLYSAWRKASDRGHWHEVVSTATLVGVSQ